ALSSRMYFCTTCGGGPSTDSMVTVVPPASANDPLCPTPVQAVSAKPAATSATARTRLAARRASTPDLHMTPTPAVLVVFFVETRASPTPPTRMVRYRQSEPSSRA